MFYNIYKMFNYKLILKIQVLYLKNKFFCFIILIKIKIDS